MNRSTLWLHVSLSFTLLATLSLMSYFGYPNPVTVGLQSSIAVGLLFTVIVIGLYFLPHKIALVAFLLLLLLYLLLTVGNWWHFQYFQVYFNYEFLRFARDSGEALRALNAFTHVNEAMVLSLVLVFSALLFWFWKRSKISHRLLKIQAVISLLLGLSFLYLANSNIELLRSVNALTLSPYYFHPVHAFFYSDEASPEGSDKKWLAFKQRNKVTQPQRFLPPDIEQKHYNIIVLTMESFIASFVGKYSDRKKSLTPNFDRIANSGILLKNFYANTNYTVKGENAMLCGIFDHNAKISIAEYDAEKNLNCMPSILKNAGYETYYYHANYGKFYNRQQFLPQIGFSQLYFHADKFPKKSDGREYIGWGLSDADMYSIVVDELTSRSASPFFAQVMSISNHYPFKFDWPIDVPNKMPESLMQKEMDTYLAYENAIVYSDYALGVFWDKFKQSSLYENTIVVITGDHGVWSFDETKGLSDIEKNEEFFRLPLYIYHPDVKTPVVIDQVASQVDLPVTLMDLLGIDFPRETFIGKNLFDEVETPWAVMMKGGEVYVRTEDTVCMPQSAACAGPYQSCWAKTGVESFLEKFGTSSCFQYDGDPLLNGSFVNALNRENLLDESFGMISYENGRIFESKGTAVLFEPKDQSFHDLKMALKMQKGQHQIE